MRALQLVHFRVRLVFQQVGVRLRSLVWAIHLIHPVS
jgi:hypothetical protein